MQLDRPLATVTPTVDGDVLAVLARADTEFTPPVAHRLIGRHSVEGVRRALRRLAEQGVVTVRRSGQAHVYALNGQHLAADAIRALARLRDALAERITGAIGTWTIAPEVVALFGSAATGSMRVDSDIDVFVVRPTNVDDTDPVWRAQIADLERDVTTWTGNDCRVLEMPAIELSRRGEGVIGDIHRDGVVLHGDRRLLRPGRRTR